MQQRVGFSVGHFGAQGDLAALGSRIATLVDMGAHICELNASNLDVVSACQIVPHRLAALKAILMNYSCAFSLHAPIAINLMDEAHIDLHMRAAHVSLELAAEIGATIVVMHPGRTHPGIWVDQSARLLQFEASQLAILAKRAEELGITIAYENLNPNRHNIAGTETSYALDLIALSAQIERVDSPALKVCFDVSHAIQGATLQGYTMLEQLPSLAQHVCHIHYSDATGVPATINWNNDGERLFFGLGDMHAAPGFGSIDFDEIAKMLKTDLNPSVVIELKENHFNHSGAQALAHAKIFAKSLVQARLYKGDNASFH